MAFFWPTAYEAIDWNKPYQALEQELQKVGVKGEIGERRIDKLFQVYLNDGTEQWILTHIEIQHTSDSNFPKRMFSYFYRIFDLYDKDIASMAILADKSLSWNPNQYHREIWESSITRTYKTVKLMDFKSQKAKLLESENPFAMVILIQIEVYETGPDDEARMLTKLQFFRSLYKKGWSLKAIKHMYRFLDIILCLNEEYTVEYETIAREIDGRQKMQIMSNIEQKAYYKGELRGELRGEAKILAKQLVLKFQTIPALYLTKIENANTLELETWALNIFRAQTIEEVFYP